MLNRLQALLAHDLQLNPDQLLLVGVSGGADSLCLLDSLVRLGYPLVIAHFNHLLRLEAGDDARIVEKVADQMEVSFVLGEGSATDFAQEHHLSIEEAARELRYRFLFEQAEKYSAQAVAVAHNADDQVETVLMHLLRGAGLDGLLGMPNWILPNPWSTSIPLIRPLLGIWRSEIDLYCSERKLIPVIDQTNQDTAYFRNRLRHELIPELENYVPGIRTRLWQTADLLSADWALLDKLTDKAWDQMISEIGKDYISIHHSRFQLQPLGLQRRLIRRAVSYLRAGARDLDFTMVHRLLDFSGHPESKKQIDIGLGMIAFLEDGKLIIATWEADLPTLQWPQVKGEWPLPVPGKVDLGNGWLLHAEMAADYESVQNAVWTNSDPYRVWLDLGDRQPLLKVRGRSPGERFRPLGMDGRSMKVSDFMINQKIPQRARAGWPLVCVGDEIVWIPGYRLAHPFRLRQPPQQIVELSIRSG